VIIVAFEQQKEALAEQIIRFIRLIPHFPGGISLGSVMTSDNQESTAAMLYERNMQNLYFKIFELALPLASHYGNGDEEVLTAAVDIVELVRNKLSGDK